MTTRPPSPRIAPTLCLILLLALLQPGCTAQRTATPNLPSAAPATAIPTTPPTPAPTVTDTPSPTETFAPTPTPIPTIAFRPPADGLKTKGPYLVYARQANSQYPYSSNDPTILVAMDADASGQVTFTLPNQGYLPNFKRSFSPDGQWIAYYTGSPSVVGEDGHYHFALHIYQWRTGEDRKVADLLSSDYPENFERTAKMLISSDPQYWGNWPDNSLVEKLNQTFLAGINATTWSPDGRYLAFAGEQDGPSSDLYLYVLSTGAVQRLTDGPANIDWLRWTPDSQRIFHHSAYYFGEGESGTYHVAQIDGKAWNLDNVSSHGGVNIFAGWVSNFQIGVFSHANGHDGPLRYLNIETGEDVVYFEDGVYDAVYDPDNQVWLVADPYPFLDGYQAGLYLVDPKTRTRKWIGSKQCFSVVFLGLQDQRFLASCGKQFDYAELTIIHQDGTITQPVDGPITSVSSLRVSPDKQKYATVDSWAHYGEARPVIAENSIYTHIYNSSGKQIDQFSGYFVKEFAWWPDSAGFYFVGLAPTLYQTNDCLYYFSLADHQVRLVDDALPKLGEYEDWAYVWTR